jgi:hypothetical protein
MQKASAYERPRSALIALRPVILDTPHAHVPAVGLEGHLIAGVDADLLADRLRETRFLGVNLPTTEGTLMKAGRADMANVATPGGAQTSV